MGHRAAPAAGCGVRMPVCLSVIPLCRRRLELPRLPGEPGTPLAFLQLHFLTASLFVLGLCVLCIRSGGRKSTHWQREIDRAQCATRILGHIMRLWLSHVAGTQLCQPPCLLQMRRPQVSWGLEQAVRRLLAPDSAPDSRLSDSNHRAKQCLHERGLPETWQTGMLQ